jgi:hypothetical protein
MDAPDCLRVASTILFLARSLTWNGHLKWKVLSLVDWLFINRDGSVTYELLTDACDIHVLENTAYYMPELPCRLFSPQAHFQELFTSGQDPRKRSGLVIKSNRGVITWANDTTTTL